MKLKTLFSAVALGILALPAGAAEDVVVLDQSRPLVAKSDMRQRFADYIDLRGGQEKLPLKFTFNNGSDSAPAFDWLRVSIAGRPYFTEKDFKNNKTLVVDMTGDLGSGSSQIVILGGGKTGATVSWNLTTPQPTLDSAKPLKVSNGQTVSLSGKYLGRSPADNVVTLAGASVPVTKASQSSLEFTVPDDAKAGKVKVAVTVLGIQAKSAKPVEITVLPKPEVTSLDLFSGAPGQILNISGKNFSTNTSEMKVTIGGQQASIASASQSSLAVEIPMALDAMSPSWGLPVVVEVNGVKSNDNVTFNVQMRNIPADEVSPVGPRD